MRIENQIKLVNLKTGKLEVYRANSKGQIRIPKGEYKVVKTSLPLKITTEHIIFTNKCYS